MKIILKLFFILFMSITAQYSIAQTSADANSSGSAKADRPKAVDKVGIAIR
jgi:hypothetical protein